MSHILRAGGSPKKEEKKGIVGGREYRVSPSCENPGRERIEKVKRKYTVHETDLVAMTDTPVDGISYTTPFFGRVRHSLKL